MSLTRLFITPLILFTSQFCEAQADSIFQAFENLQKVPVKYLKAVENKIDKYSNSITGKTERTLIKLSHWEKKIKELLDKVSPETSQRLFGNNQLTFATALQKLKDGKTIVEGYRVQYNEYRDKLNTSLRYLQTQKEKVNSNLIQPVKSTIKKMDELEEDVKNTEAIEQFIKQRKQQLIEVALKYLGKNKYLSKINKEVY